MAVASILAEVFGIRQKWEISSLRWPLEKREPSYYSTGLYYGYA